MLYKYWDNSKIWHGALLLTVEAETIGEADKVFETTMGLNVVKCQWISCELPTK